MKKGVKRRKKRKSKKQFLEKKRIEKFRDWFREFKFKVKNNIPTRNNRTKKAVKKKVEIPQLQQT